LPKFTYTKSSSISTCNISKAEPFTTSIIGRTSMPLGESNFFLLAFPPSTWNTQVFLHKENNNNNRILIVITWKIIPEVTYEWSSVAYPPHPLHGLVFLYLGFGFPFSSLSKMFMKEKITDSQNITREKEKKTLLP